MSFLKSIKYTMILSSTLYILLGLASFTNMLKADLLIYALAGGLAIIGGLMIIRYFFTKIDVKFKRNDFVVGAIFALIALILFMRITDFVAMTSLVFGVMIIVDGIFKLQDGFDMAMFGHSLVLQISAAIIVIILGVLLMYDPFVEFISGLNASALPMFTGGTLVFCGASDLVSNVFLAAYKASYDKHKDDCVCPVCTPDDVVDPEEFIVTEEEKKAD